MSSMLPALMTLLAAVRAAAPEVVSAVDLKRYAGRWHEIARLPNRFQRHCAGVTRCRVLATPSRSIDRIRQL